MKLRNKKTGGVDDFKIEAAGLEWVGYTSLKEFCEDYEDYEEPKEWWFIDAGGEVVETTYITDYDKTNLRKFGNYFETKEEAEKAVEKLKIYNKLKQKGFVFSGWYYSTEGQLVILADNHEFSETEPEDLTELFGDKIC